MSRPGVILSTRADVDMIHIRLMGGDHRQPTKGKQFYVTKDMAHKHCLTPCWPACQKMGQREKTQQGRDKRRHQDFFEVIVRQVGLRKAKKMKVNNADWEARVRVAEQQPGHQEEPEQPEHQEEPEQPEHQDHEDIRENGTCSDVSCTSSSSSSSSSTSQTNAYQTPPPADAHAPGYYNE